jgi:hypothetical protein
MALYPVQPGIQPLGMFDVDDTTLSGLKGGEVMMFGSASTANSTSETAAADVLDGYTFATPAGRPVAVLADTADAPFVALADEGTGPDYFTLLGTVVGGKTGLVVSGGAVNGPHTATASGKVTLWDKPGLYEVTVDALPADFASAALVPGASVLGFTDAGQLQRAGGSDVILDSGCAVFVEFAHSSSLVTTPAYLVSASAAHNRVKVMFLGAAQKALV